MIDTDEYKEYLKDQHKDNMFEEQYLSMGKSWTYRYCNFLKNLLKTFDYSTSRILDVGCREFFTYDYFLEKHDNKIDGIDVGEEGLNYTAKEKKPAIYCDAHKIPDTYKSDWCDLVVSFHAFEHMYDLPKVLKNCDWVLKEGGYLYFAVPVPVKNEKRGHWYDIPSVEAMTKICEEAGFEKVFTKQFPKGMFRNEQEMVGLFKVKR